MISCVVLTKNEENKIVDCLESVSWCDEIIIIDDYSNDNTIEIIKNYNDSGQARMTERILKHIRQAQCKQVQNDNKKIKIYRKHLNGDFAGQRNFGLGKASGEWILFVDADERVSEELKGEILKQVQDDEKRYDGFYIRRKDFLFGKWLEHGETGNIKMLRLVRKDKGRWERRVHEELRVSGEVGELGGTLLHYPHQTVSEFLKEINFYTDLNAQEFYENYRHAEFSSASKRILKQVQDDTFIFLYPLAKFIKNYFLKLGFLDGMAGFLQASFMSFHSFLTRGKLWEMWDSGHLPADAYASGVAGGSQNDETDSRNEFGTGSETSSG